jgi:hypothetical protein
VLALGLSGNPVIRADFEDEMASRVPATEIEMIPGSAILLRPEGAEFDLDYLKTQIREHKIDAVVVSWLVKIDNTVTYIPGLLICSVLQHLLPLLPRRISWVYSPGYLKEEKKVRIEITFYSVSSTEGELVWTCIADISTLHMRRRQLGRS